MADDAVAAHDDPPQEAAAATPARLLAARALGIGAALAAALVAYTAIVHWNEWVGSARHQHTDDAYLEADLTPIGARVAGYVEAIPAQDFAHVKAGDLLVQIDRSDYQATLDQARANEGVAQAARANLVAQADLQAANIKAAQATVSAAQAVAERAGKAARRQRVLLTGGAGSQDSLEAAEAADLAARADVLRTNATVVAATRQLAVLGAQLHQADAALHAAAAATHLAQINLDRTRIVAPQAGVLGQRMVRRGQYLAVGGQVTSLTPLPHVWVIANFKETQLTHMRVGQPATLTVDAFPGRLLKGHVLAFAPASGSQFALLPPDNATGNFTKVVQRLAVKIVLDDTDGLTDQLRAGLSVVADVDTGRR